MIVHSQAQWTHIETDEQNKADWSLRLADKTRQTIRNAFAKFQYVKSRYRNDVKVFTDICLNMTPLSILASLREFRNLCKLLAHDARAWASIPANERSMIIHAARIAGLMILVPAWVVLSGIMA